MRRIMRGRVATIHHVTTKVYIRCPVCHQVQVEVAGLPPHQMLVRHYVPGTVDECTNHGSEFRGLTTR
jgi:hypothetical protein